jgi:4-coumarate--CoA ligase
LIKKLTDSLLKQVLFLAYLPMFHAAMTPFAHVAPLRAGHVTYVLRRFEIEALLRSIHQYQITDIVFVPPVVFAILKSSLTQRFSLKSLKNVMSGAGPLDRQNQRALQQLLAPNAALNQVWGMTETTCVASRFYYPEQDNTGSVGYMMPNIDVK